MPRIYGDDFGEKILLLVARVVVLVEEEDIDSVRSFNLCMRRVAEVIEKLPQQVNKKSNDWLHWCYGRMVMHCTNSAEKGKKECRGFLQ
jgi:hypothetical protein